MAASPREVAPPGGRKYTADLADFDQHFGEILDQTLTNGTAGSTRWVNLGRACEILGVNESTVRRWADSGEIRCFRTPGGHRRFAESDLYAMTESGGRRPESDLETAAVSRIRRQLHAGSKSGPAGWYATLEEEERDVLRPLGRRLVELVGDYISRRGRRAQVEHEVDEIGRRYGQILHERGMPLMRAVQAFTFFRRSLDETAKRLAERNSMTGEEAARAREDIAGLADRVLLGLAAAYDPR
ncbi:MAG: helix-turn-helix domain-containing protein [Dehalococcoidia bacterium]|nr:helix-turn-helix domain-containing protein [Dehalococcoidia bacterium]